MNIKLTPEKQHAFLAVLAETCRIGDACKAIGITRQTAYNWRAADPVFKNQWDEAVMLGISVLEDELTRRAMDGQDEVTLVNGVETKRVRKFDNKLLLALLRASNPNKYCTQVQRDEITAVRNSPQPALTNDELAAGLNRLAAMIATQRAPATAELDQPEVEDLT